MSFHVTSICTNHKFGSATRKQVITFLADKASDDGSGIWCSKGTVAQSTELSESTVKRVFLQFLSEGVIFATGRRNKETCQQIFAEAVSQGVAPEDIIAAVQAYAQTTAGYTRGKVKFSDNWFHSASWEDHVAARTEEAKTNELVLQDSLERCKSWIVSRDRMCRYSSHTDARPAPPTHLPPSSENKSNASLRQTTAASSASPS